MPQPILLTKHERKIKRAERRERQREESVLRARQMHIARLEHGVRGRQAGERLENGKLLLPANCPCPILRGCYPTSRFETGV